MALATYSELVSAVTDEMKDSSLEAKVPQFIALAESQFNRMLYALEDEASATITVAADTGSTALPETFRKLRSLYIASDSSRVLQQLSPDDFKALYLDASTGQPVHFAIYDGAFQWGPVPDGDYTVTAIYIQGIPALTSDNPTNWLLESHPDLYLYGSLRQAELYGWNDERAKMFDTFIDNVLAQIRMADAIKRRGDWSGEVAGCYF